MLNIIKHSGIIFELLAFLSALYFFKKLQGTFYIYIIPFLGYIFLTEFIATFFKNNVFLYVPEFFIENAFFFFLFYNILQHNYFKKTTLFLFLICFIFYLTELFTMFNAQQLFVPHNSYITGRLCLLILYFVYLTQLLVNKNYTSPFSTLSFWVLSGMFVFTIFTLSKESIHYTFDRIDDYTNTTLKTIGYVASNIFYLFIIIGLYKCHPTQKY